MISKYFVLFILILLLISVVLFISISATYTDKINKYNKISKYDKYGGMVDGDEINNSSMTVKNRVAAINQNAQSPYTPEEADFRRKELDKLNRIYDITKHSDANLVRIANGNIEFADKLITNLVDTAKGEADQASIISKSIRSNNLEGAIDQIESESQSLEQI